MEDTTNGSRLRYLAANDVDDTVVDYDGLHVEGADGERIGDVAGFIVDAQACRLHFVVVDSGGWLRSRRFLIPVGHATLSNDPRVLCVDVTRAALSRYPDFDEDRFREFSDDDMAVFETRMAEACCPETPLREGFGAERHHVQPNWWTSSEYTHERLRPVDTGVYAAMPPPRERFPGAERVRAHASDTSRDVSPHIDGRAQPGDVIGIETGGERTLRRGHERRREPRAPRG